MDDIHFALRPGNCMYVCNSSRGVGYLNILSKLKFEQQARKQYNNIRAYRYRLDGCNIYSQTNKALKCYCGRKGVASRKYVSIYSDGDEYITRIYKHLQILN